MTTVANQPDTRTAYRSPFGTFEPVLKSVLEDMTLGDEAFRLLGYLLTKPVISYQPGRDPKPMPWILREKQLAVALDRSVYWVRKATKELRDRGYVEGFQPRDEHGRKGRWVNQFTEVCKSKVIAPTSADTEFPQVSTGDPKSHRPGVTWENTALPQVGTGDPKTGRPGLGTLSEYGQVVNTFTPQTPSEDLHNTPEQQQLASLAAVSEPLASLGGSDHIGGDPERTRRLLASVPDLPPDPYDYYDDQAQA